jgi:hypothetical protein
MENYAAKVWRTSAVRYSESISVSNFHPKASGDNQTILGGHFGEQNGYLAQATTHYGNA